jgi:hypothetical protein
MQPKVQESGCRHMHLGAYHLPSLIQPSLTTILSQRLTLVSSTLLSIKSGSCVEYTPCASKSTSQMIIIIITLTSILTLMEKGEQGLNCQCLSIVLLHDTSGSVTAIPHFFFSTIHISRSDDLENERGMLVRNLEIPFTPTNPFAFRELIRITP